MSSKSIYTPYTYLIGWSDRDTWYYGVRYAKNCHPDDLWKKYFTSSKYVKEFREKYGEPDVIQVRKTFSDGEKARDWEDQVILRLKLHLDERFLNKNRSKGISLSHEEWLRINQNPEKRKKISEALKGKSKSLEHKNRLRQAALARDSSTYTVHTEEHKEKVRQRQLKNNVGFSLQHTCPICNKTGQAANMIRHHGKKGEKCRFYSTFFSPKIATNTSRGP